jgi:pyridoxal phosphate enzyme (YggS family)
MPLTDNDLATRLAAVHQRILSAEDRARRPAGSVTLLAVSKTFPAEAVRACAAAGQRRFGENYLQEATEKIGALHDLDLEWHFIGPLQSNKTRPVAELFHWVHSVDRLRIAERLSSQRPAGLPPLNICLQVNVSGEESKSGTTLAELPALAEAVRALPGLRLRGLMAIPAPADNPEAQRLPFRTLRLAFEALNARGLALDTLSMGMSDDLEAAILEGATLVRVGSAIFGHRDYGEGH